MEFDLRAHSADTLRSVYDFEGDTAVDSSTYKKCMSDGYMSTLSFVKGAAESIGLDLDAETLERWKRVGNAAYLIDEYLDTAPDIETACQLYETGMRQVFEVSSQQIADGVGFPAASNERLAPAIALLKNSVSALPNEQVTLLKDAALAINMIARRKLQCDNVTDYATLLKREAWYTSILITASASEATYAQPNYADFVQWCEQSMTLGTLGDSAIDLKRDYKNGITQVRPNMLNVARLTLSVYRPGREMIHTAKQRYATIGSLVERSRFHRSFTNKP